MKCLFLWRMCFPFMSCGAQPKSTSLHKQGTSKSKSRGQSLIAPVSSTMSIHMLTVWANGLYLVAWSKHDLAAGHWRVIVLADVKKIPWHRSLCCDFTPYLCNPHQPIRTRTKHSGSDTPWCHTGIVKLFLANIYPSLFHQGFRGQLEPILVVIGQRQDDTLDNSPAHCWPTK